MRQKDKVRNITTVGLLIATGLILPYVTAHAFGIPGTILLPMHFPVFLMGMLCGPFWGLLGGVVTPVLSSVLTGMPALYPMLPVMVGELAVYGFVGGLLYRLKGMKIYPAFLISMFAGRVVHGVIFAIAMLAGGKAITFASVFASNIEGLPGTVLLLILIPAIVKGLEKLLHWEYTGGRYKESEIEARAKEMIASGKCSFIIIKDERIVYKDSGNGVKPIIKVIDENRELLKDAVIVDKIIGKAAALLLDLGGAKKVYGALMSKAAKEYLSGKRIEFGCGRCIQVINNRKGDGICPLERAVNDIDDPAEAYDKLKETIADLMRQAG
ncbi:MAG: ECF transporter S component [Bacillota bacterium]|nr:ECF transporter S component [Bacillota bacterium]